MFKAFIPRDEVFFDFFDRIGASLVTGVETLVKMVDSGGNIRELAVQTKTIEHETDQLVHGLMAHLHKTFVTPIDREDIHHLAVSLDDILDQAEAASSRIDQYCPECMPGEVRDISLVLLESVKLVQEMVGLLRNLKKSGRILELAVEINRLEDEADLIRRGTIARLFREEKNPFELIKWKDILEYIEKATDCCEDVANILEGIVLENT
jgi:predicted phosphate transport protein (TIGR00153 family)